MIQVLDAFELLYFTMLRPVLTWRAFGTYEPLFIQFSNFVSGRGEPWILNQRILQHTSD
jgi:hypothetical protein